MIWVRVPTLKDRPVGSTTIDHLILNESLFGLGNPLRRGGVIFIPAIEHAELNPSPAQVILNRTRVFCPIGPGIIDVEAKVVQVLADRRPIRLHPLSDCLHTMIRSLDRANPYIREDAADSLNIDCQILRGAFGRVAAFWWSTGECHCI